MNNLTSLALNANLLISLPVGVFNGMDSLSFVALIENPLRELPRGILDDVLDTLGSKYSFDNRSFRGRLWIDPHLKATIAFASTAQRVAEGTAVRVAVTLSRALPVAVSGTLCSRLPVGPQADLRACRPPRTAACCFQPGRPAGKSPLPC